MSSQHSMPLNTWNEIKQLPGNLKCVDCGSANPQWASVSYGTLFCLQCSGKHRSLGVHLSFVRSVTMDSWTDKQIRMMKLGNGNETFLNTLIDNSDLNSFKDTYKIPMSVKYNSQIAAWYRDMLRAKVDGNSFNQSCPNENFNNRNNNMNNNMSNNNNNNNIEGNSDLDNYIKHQLEERDAAKQRLREKFGNGGMKMDAIGSDPNYVPGGHTRPLKWWHGNGGLLDYSNPEAKDWWHSKMDNVLDMGVDGFKTDGTDPYIIEYMLGGGAYNYKGDQVTYRDYAAWYYQDFFYYPKEHSNWEKNETLIMSRPVDCATSKGNWGCMGFSPHDVMLSGWVGDDDSTWNGLRSCMRKLIFSAWDNYALYGCDIGGYRSKVNNEWGRDKETFIRWAQLGSVVSLMENGGGGTHEPWLFDDETLNIYAKYVDLHYQLIPYMMTIGTDAYNNGVSAMVPLIPRPTDQPNKHPDPKSLSYSLGDSIYIHPIVDNYTDIHEITFPDANDNDEICSYINFWDAKDIYECNTKILKKYELDEYPIFLKTGSMLPFYSNQYEEKLKIVMVNPFGCSISKLGYSSDKILLDGNGCSNNMKMYEWQDNGVEGSYNIISSNDIPKDNKDEFSLYLDLSIIQMDINISSYNKKQVQIEIRDEYLALKAKLNFVSFFNENDMKNPLDMDLSNIDSGIILIDNLDASNGLNIVAYVMDLNKE